MVWIVGMADKEENPSARNDNDDGMNLYFASLQFSKSMVIVIKSNYFSPIIFLSFHFIMCNARVNSLLSNGMYNQTRL